MGYRSHFKKLAAMAGIVTTLTAMSIAPAMAASDSDSSAASATITAGTLATTLGDVAFGDIAYQFAARTVSTPNVALSVADSTGTDAGYQVSITATDLASGGAGPDIAATAFKVAAVDNVAIVGGEGSNGEMPTVPAISGNLSGTGQVVLSAAAGTGAGNYSADVDFDLAIPENTLADTYSGTLTTTVVVAP